MSDTPFFTQQWAHHFSKNSGLIVLPQEMQKAYINWLDCCQNPTCFLTDTKDVLGHRLHQAQRLLQDYRKMETVYDSLNQQLKSIAQIQGCAQPHKKSQVINKKMLKASLKSMSQLAQQILSLSPAVRAPQCQKKSSYKWINDTQFWARKTYLQCTKAIIHQTRVNYRLHLTLTFQRQSLLLNQSPSYWRALTDKRALQNLAESPEGSASQTPSKTHCLQSSTSHNTHQAFSLNQLYAEHVKNVQMANIPHRPQAQVKTLQCYQSVLTDLPEIRKHAQNELAFLKKMATCPSNKYQIMSHQQLIHHALTSQHMLDTSLLMQTQIQSPSFSTRLWRKFKNQFNSKTFHPKFQGNTRAGAISSEDAMLQDIGKKHDMILCESTLILKAMLNRMMLCAYTGQFTADDTLWHIHQKLDDDGLTLFSATPITTDSIDNLPLDAVYIRQSQNLIQIAQMCHLMLSFPNHEARIRKLQNQLLTLPLLDALPHLKDAPYSSSTLMAIYYNTSFWSQLYQHYLTLNQNDLPDIPTLHHTQQSLLNLQHDFSQCMQKLSATQQCLASTKKAKKYTERSIDQLLQKCYQHRQKHRAQDYQQQVSDYAKQIVHSLLMCNFDWVQDQLQPFSDPDNTLIPCEHPSTAQGTFIQLHSKDLRVSLQEALKKALHTLLPNAAIKSLTYHDTHQLLHDINYCLNSAWPNLGQNCQSMIEQGQAELVLLSACSPWNPLTSESVRQACSLLKDCKHLKKRLQPHLTGSIAQLFRNYIDPHYCSGRDHHMQLLSFCELEDAKKDYKHICFMRKKAWFKIFSYPMEDVSLPSDEYPALKELMTQFQKNTSEALTQIQNTIQEYYVLSEALCDHIADQVVLVVNKDLSTIDPLAIHYYQCANNALLELVESFSKTQMADMNQCQNAICFWMSALPQNLDPTQESQMWVLGGEALEKLTTEIYEAIRHILMCLSQIQRVIDFHSKSPPTLYNAQALRSEAIDIIIKSLPTNSKNQYLPEIYQIACETIPFPQPSKEDKHFKAIGESWGRLFNKKSREPADKPGSVMDSHLSRH